MSIIRVFIIVCCFTCAALFLVVISIALIAVCIDRKANDYIKVKLSDFKKWYAISDERWRLFQASAKRADNCIGVYFGFFGTIPYMIWHASIRRQKQRSIDNQRTAELLSAVQRDINRVRQEGEFELQKAKFMMDKITHI